MDLREFRQAKDDYFKRGHDSPLTLEERHSFAGLRYYPEDPALRLVVDLDTTEAGGEEEVEMSDGSADTMARAGHFSFPVDGETARLTAFRSEGDLFIPFRDATNRDETYPAGRYVEAEPLPDGRWLLDLNRAYNPYCAYNDQWRCPLPPQENWLTVAIRAGEKRFH